MSLKIYICLQKNLSYFIVVTPHQLGLSQLRSLQAYNSCITGHTVLYQSYSHVYLFIILSFYQTKITRKVFSEMTKRPVFDKLKNDVDHGLPSLAAVYLKLCLTSNTK